jgi:hypothetical protein
MSFKIEIRKKCKVCNIAITGKRCRTYCSAACRTKFFNKKYSKAHTDWNRIKRDREALIASPEKIQCLICKKYYVQVCTHALQVHGINGRQYREKFGLEVKKGVVPLWYRKLKGDQALNNKTYRNLKAGKTFWFVKGDKKAGRYTRSPITLAKLRVLYKSRKIKK